MAGSRIVVEEPVYDAFVKKLVAKVGKLKVGDPREHDTVVGPLITVQQCKFIAGQIADAKGKGATVLTGGSYEGQYFKPTILTGVTREMAVYREESFGPVVAVYRAKDAEDALRIANDSPYGLSAALITNDFQKALDLAMRLESGMVHVNHSTAYDEPHVPFGGVKESGMGREGGHFSMEEMTELKWVTMQLGQRHYPF